MSKFSERLKERRKEKKMTQQTLADLVGVNRVTYTNWENGKREPELDKVAELATELNTTIDYLLGNSDTNYLDITENEIYNLTKEEAKELTDELKKHLLLIFEIGKNKFDITDEEMEVLKTIVFKNALKDTDQKDSTNL